MKLTNAVQNLFCTAFYIVYGDFSCYNNRVLEKKRPHFGMRREES